MSSKKKTYEETELDILVKSSTDPENRPVVEKFIPEILKLVNKFRHSGQSGGSVNYTAKTLANTIEKLCLQEPICPITGIDEEWIDVSSYGGEIQYQNKRCSALFKDKNEVVRYIDAIVFDGDIGGRFTGNGSVTYNGESISSSQCVKKFPFTPKTFYIDVIDHRWKDKEETQIDVNGDWWTHTIKDPKQLEKVYEYYKKPPITRKVLVEKKLIIHFNYSK